jgi:hypothetical protein
MKKGLLFLIMIFFTLFLQAQQTMKKSEDAIANSPSNDISGTATLANVNIYPVPVRNYNFTIKTDRDISSVKITNIIGQDILKIKYNNPQQEIRVFLDYQKRGMYLVTLHFTDGSRVVKKIMIEESE